MPGRCECADRECPVHKGYSECPCNAKQAVARVDYEPEEAILLCDGCAADAFECGLFYEVEEN